MSDNRPPALLAWHMAARKASLTALARYAMLMLAGHVNGKRDVADAFLAMETLADEMGVARNTAKRCLDELEAAGIVTYARRSKGRTSHRWLLHLEAVPKRPPKDGEDTGSDGPGSPAPTRTNPSAHGGLARPSSDAEPGNPCRDTRHRVSGNPSARDQKPLSRCSATNNHPSIQVANEHKGAAPLASNGMDGPDKRADPDGTRAKRKALREYGVEGPNLTQLAAHPSITLALILGEWERITQAEGVRNRPAVLAAALAAHAGIQLGSKRISAADLDPDALRVRREAEAAQARLEEIRRQQQRNQLGEAS